MKKVFIFNGVMTSGKTTFENYCVDYITNKYLNKDIFITSIIDPTKRLVSDMGLWNGKKTPVSRKFLSDMKDLLDEYCAYSMLRLSDIIADAFKHDCVAAVFVDMRQPDDIAEFIEDYSDIYDISTVIVRRKGDDALAAAASNHADREVFNYSYDIVIENNGSLEDLTSAAKTFVEEYVID